MARRKIVKKEGNSITLDVLIDADLLLRLAKISKQTGLAHKNLIQKWVLQEETLIGITQKARLAEISPKAARRVSQKTSGVKGQEKNASAGAKRLAYKSALAKRVKKLKKEGMTLKKIVETFNEEKVPTVSGAGKWHTSSITWLLNAAKAK